MARKLSVEAAQELNLTPIMNIVLVLIPLMLLSVVFMVISVIDVTMPQRSAGSASNSGEPPKRLQLFVSKQGFTVVKTMESVPAIEGCPSDGPTICLSNAEASIDVDKLNWLALYNMLFEIKQQPEWSEHEQIEIIADSAVNFGVLVKAMDISRFQVLPKADLDTATKGRVLLSVDELNNSGYVTQSNDVGRVPVSMFPVVILGLPTMN